MRKIKKQKVAAGDDVAAYESDDADKECLEHDYISGDDSDSR